MWSIPWSRAPSLVTLALAGDGFLLSPRVGCCAGLEAVGQRAVYATTEADWPGSRLGHCVLSTIRTGLCAAFSESAGVRSTVVAQIAV